MTTAHRMPASTAIEVLAALRDGGAEVCVGGGWAVDAVVGRQTREHSDLDLWLPAHHLEPLFETLASLQIDRVLPVPGDRPWNFVLHDGASRRVDLHLYERLSNDSIHFGSVTDGAVFPVEALAARGTIGDLVVTCEAPEWSVRWHAGYPLRATDHHDLELLCTTFGLERSQVAR